MSFCEQEAEKRYYSIREAAESLRIKPTLVRSWLRYFGTLRPRVGRTGTLRLTADHLRSLRLIYHLTKEKGYTLRGAMRVLKTDKKQLMHQQRVLEHLRVLRAFLVDVQDKVLGDG